MKHNAILRIILFSITIVVLLAILAAGLTLRRWEWRLNPLAASPEESMAAVPAEEGTASRDSAVTLSSSQVRDMEIRSLPFPSPQSPMPPTPGGGGTAAASWPLTSVRIPG